MWPRSSPGQPRRPIGAHAAERPPVPTFFDDDRTRLQPADKRSARSAAPNREIAAALFITVKAVEGHLGNTYRKLQIGGRGELATRLAP
jgi:hypothetical protein